MSFCANHERFDCPYCEIERLNKELTECKALFKAESEFKEYKWAEVMRLRKENMRLKEAPMDCCESCKNYEKKEEKIKWSGEAYWFKSDQGFVYPDAVLPVPDWERLIGKRTEITIKEI